MDWLWIALSIIIVFIGIIGAVLPVIPGPIVAYVALLILQLTSLASKYSGSPFNEEFLVIMGLITAGVTVLDYIVPIYGTKKFGGSKAGVRGSMIGLVVGIIILPMVGIVIGPFGVFGIILGPFIGAYIGESMTGKESNAAFKAAFGSFIGFLAGTLMKLIFGFVCAWYVFKGAFFM